MRQVINYPNVLDAKASTGASKVIFARDFRNAVVAVSAPVNSTFTIKFAGAIGDTAPDFTSAQSSTNIYDFLQVVDLQSGSAIAGDTGVTIDNTGADVNNRMFEINTNAVDWICIIVSSYTDGSVTASITLTDNA